MKQTMKSEKENKEILLAKKRAIRFYNKVKRHSLITYAQVEEACNIINCLFNREEGYKYYPKGSWNKHMIVLYAYVWQNFPDQLRKFEHNMNVYVDAGLNFIYELIQVKENSEVKQETEIGEQKTEIIEGV